MFTIIVSSLVILAIPLNVIAWLMKSRVNAALPEDKQFSWWSRDFRGVNRAYRENFPNSVLPDIDRYGGYAIWILFAGLILVSLLSRNS